MPGALFHLGGTALCPHGGRVTVVSTNARVLVNGLPVATRADTYPIAGCPCTVGGIPQSCMRVRWVRPATRVFVNGKPAILQASQGICLNAEQAPQGTPVIVAGQKRVIGIGSRDHPCDNVQAVGGLDYAREGRIDFADVVWLSNNL